MMLFASKFPCIEDEVLDNVGDNPSSMVIHQTTAVTIRRRRLPGTSTEVAAISFRACHEKYRDLWDTALRLLDCQIPTHPSLVSVLGISCKSSSSMDAKKKSSPSAILMEMMPTSLYEVLHVERLQLTTTDILFIATEVLTALQYLHILGETFGSTLTSRKVMFGGSRHVKLRRFCSESVGRGAGVHKADSVWASHYTMPHQAGLDSLSPLELDQRRDLYSFGMLLLELCTGGKPSVELLNSISLVSRVDPRLDCIVRATLMLEHRGDSTDSIEQPTAYGPRKLMDLCMGTIRECACSSTELRSFSDLDFRSCRDFKSFLHADHFARSREDRLVDQRVRDRTVQSAVALKRLASVEEELVEEQKNFEVVVKQLEQLQIEKYRDERRIQELLGIVQHHEADMEIRDSTDKALRAECDECRAKTAAIEVELEHTKSSLAQARADQHALNCERQELLIEVLRVKDEKRLCLDQKQEIQRQLLEEAAKVGGEKDALEELEARWRQAIHRCEQEQLARRLVERQMEAISQQLTMMEDERSRYSSALQIAPTGQLDARSTRNLVLELKEKEIVGLRGMVQQLSHEVLEARDQFAACIKKCTWLEQTVCTELHEQIKQLKHEATCQIDKIDSLTKESDSLRLRLDDANCRERELKETTLSLEAEMKNLQTQVADAEKARRLRQCLTPNCDAPRYLVKASGFCLDCEEKMAKERGKSRSSASPSLPFAPSPAGGEGNRGHRRQRSLDGIRAILNNTKNTTVIDLVKRIEVARDCDDEGRDESCLELVSIVKQLGKVLKESPSLKEDLPECGVLRSILGILEQFISTLPIILECFRTLSIIVFNHDRNRLILVAEGVVEIVLRVMRGFSREVKVQEAGAVLITNLSHNCESNRQRIQAAGGVEAVLDLMQAFPRDRNAQKKSCWALLTLAGSDFMCEEIASLGGIGATLAAMLNCPDDEDVQHYGCWTLLNLVAGTKHIQDFARREGVGEVVEAALAYFPEHAGIQQKCGEILNLLHHTEDKSS